ncbi:MAG: hypothetical protein NTX52_02160 [Planctomycetota bacterium]|nr:hypothetical protein [Planctomycetota bacterium]
MPGLRTSVGGAIISKRHPFDRLRAKGRGRNNLRNIEQGTPNVEVKIRDASHERRATGHESCSYDVCDFHPPSQKRKGVLRRIPPTLLCPP